MGVGGGGKATTLWSTLYIPIYISLPRAQTAMVGGIEKIENLGFANYLSIYIFEFWLMYYISMHVPFTAKPEAPHCSWTETENKRSLSRFGKSNFPNFLVLFGSL
jgi:hypothetical protein